MNKNEEFSLLLQAKRKFTKVVRNIFVVLLLLSMSFTSYAKHKNHIVHVYITKRLGIPMLAKLLIMEMSIKDIQERRMVKNSTCMQ